MRVNGVFFPSVDAGVKFHDIIVLTSSSKIKEAVWFEILVVYMHKTSKYIIIFCVYIYISGYGSTLYIGCFAL